MRDETGQWLEPMLVEAEERDIDVRALMMQATMPAAETCAPWLRTSRRFPCLVMKVTMSKLVASIGFGSVNCCAMNSAGMTAYAAYPDFPEARDLP